MKTLGQVMMETLAEFIGSPTKWEDASPAEQEGCERAVQAVITAWIEQNAEPVGVVKHIPQGGANRRDAVMAHLYDKSLPNGTKLFAAPQPLPSVEDIDTAVRDAYTRNPDGVDGIVSAVCALFTKGK